MSEEEQGNLEEKPTQDLPPGQAGSGEQEEAETLVMSSRSSLDTPQAEEPPAKPPKADDGWVTAQVSRAGTAKPGTEKAEAEADSGWAEAGKPAEPVSASAKAEPTIARPAKAEPVEAASSAAFAEGAQPAEKSGGMWEKIGITDKKTQQWVMIGGAALIVVCCLCSCVIAVIALLSSGG
jgi:hypothetical protein